ncbi:Uncharacterised protein [Pantoea agglomerans]|uniref:Uncharacterized protein n=1 Tax=Enterobacter agglomerans TaxID=549 RepID=A0A379LTA6_ENTAG|nr:Uncharacterised protein [Pantoea agglomerans]
MFRVMSPKGFLQRPGLRAGVGEIIRPLASHIHIFTSPRAWQAVNPDIEHKVWNGRDPLAARYADR